MRYGLLIKAWAIIILTAGGFVCLAGLAEDVSGRPDSQPENQSGENPALEQLAKCADTFYTNEKAGISRLACFVQAPEIFKSQQYRSRYILEKVDYEMIWEPDKALIVKPRDIPAYFGRDARIEAELYAKGIAAQLQEMSKITGPVAEIIRQISALRKTERYEIKSAAEGKLQKIELTARKADRPKRRPGRAADGGQAENTDAEKPETAPADTTIWLNAANQITRFEIIGAKEKLAGVLTPVKYNKVWNIKQLDITSYKISRPEKKESESDPALLFDFKDRVKVEITYAYPADKAMVASNILIIRLDKDGKTLVRRNEVNPINVIFTKHEVEKSK